MKPTTLNKPLNKPREISSALWKGTNFNKFIGASTLIYFRNMLNCASKNICYSRDFAALISLWLASLKLCKSSLKSLSLVQKLIHHGSPRSHSDCYVPGCFLNEFSQTSYFLNKITNHTFVGRLSIDITTLKFK